MDAHHYVGDEPPSAEVVTAATEAIPEAIRVTGAAVNALGHDDAEGCARELAGFLDHPDDTVLCGRINALISIQLQTAVNAALDAVARTHWSAARSACTCTPRTRRAHDWADTILW